VANFLERLQLVERSADVARSWLNVTKWSEEQVRHRLDELVPPADTPEPPQEPARPEAPTTLNSKMRELLDRALDQSTRGSQVELFHHILDQLVADEARIIGALSDGSASPLVNVHAWARPRVPGRAVLENASLIGRSANLGLPAMVPTYVGHLLSLGLLEDRARGPGTEDGIRGADGRDDGAAGDQARVAGPADREGRQADAAVVRSGPSLLGGHDAAGLAVSDVVVLGLQSWSEITHDFGANWLIYLSMPVVAAFVGWSTKIVALEMIYRPLEFKGIGPIGWQGIVPRRAGKVGSKTIELLTSNLLKPEELLDRVDADDAVEALRGPLIEAVDAIARDLAEQIRPGLWDSLPEAGRRAVKDRIEAQAPGIVENILVEMKADLSRYVDLQFLAVTTLVRNKEKLVKLMRSVSDDAMAFVRRSGIVFGLAIGFVQMIAWALFKNPWIMPAFGFAVGFISDYIALNMLFRPVHQMKFLGFIPFQGLLHAQRAKITRDYAKILADDLFSPEILLDGVLKGPGSDKLFALVAKEIDAAIDAQTGIARPLVVLAVGTERYRKMKNSVVKMVVERVPTTLVEAQDYAVQVIDLENTIVEKMNQLTNEEYESILRPIFKDDEPLMIAVGAILGGLVGELQVQIVELFAH
jgi:uncharacterized membrane protein YheB (UPF0754 family)